MGVQILYCICLFFVLEQISSVDSLVMTSVACGEAHSMALNEWGQLYAWGSDSCCQLGRIKINRIIYVYKVLIDLSRSIKELKLMRAFNTSQKSLNI